MPTPREITVEEVEAYLRDEAKEMDAHDHLPQLLRDRSALRPLELVVADDWRSDLQVLAWVEGEYQVCYLNTLFFRCVGTGRIVAWAVKPMVARLDDKTKTQLCRADMAMLLAMMIREHGLPRDYALNLLLENATATLSELDEMLFQSAFSGRWLTQMGQKLTLRHS